MVNVRNSFVATPPNDGGVLHSAPLGTEFPDTALDTLVKAFEDNDHGAVGDNGVGINKSRSTQKIRMLGGGTFREPQTEYDETVTITLLEDDNTAVLVDEFGADNIEITEDDDGTVHKKIFHMPEQLPIQSWIVTLIDGKKTKRYLIELGQLTQTAELTDVHSDVTKHAWTITTYASTKFGGAHIVELRADGSVVAVAGRGIVEGQQIRAARVASIESGEAADSAEAGSGDVAPDGEATAAPAEKAAPADSAAVADKPAEPAPTDKSAEPATAESAAPQSASASKSKSTGTASTSK
ncbi:hypothetical protein [Rhodococcoides fascians]|uniref:hypothetical protein n=1 Tax=Rhodococcoides fascians TaxID=1828 RepID=UPI000A6B5A5C|nr:hypothetical protein [Rhodococcus fascians]